MLMFDRIARGACLLKENVQQGVFVFGHCAVKVPSGGERGK